jgi:hypothetical protein
MSVCVERRVLRGTLRPRREEVTGYNDLQNEEFRNLYFSPNIVKAIESKTIKWEGHRRGETCIQIFSQETLGEETTFEI